MRDHGEKDRAARFEPFSFPGGAALVDPEDGRAWVLIDDGAVERFGPALAWAWRQGSSELQVLVQEAGSGVGGGASGVMARRAAEMVAPPKVWQVRGRKLVEGRPEEPLRLEADRVSDADRDYVELLQSHGADPILEHGVWRGEVLGLEVARIVGGQLQVGVGRHDRQARLEMRPGEDVGRALDEAVLAVTARRRGGQFSHPANTLARSRWLRSVVCAQPALVGAIHLEPVSPPRPWFDLAEVGAAPAVGGALDGGDRLVVVCSVGIDLDLVPTSADCRTIYAPEARLVIVVPEGDDPPVTRALAALLARPAYVVTVPRRWENLQPGF